MVPSSALAEGDESVNSARSPTRYVSQNEMKLIFKRMQQFVIMSLWRLLQPMPTPSTTPSFKKNTNANNAALQVLFFAILNLEPRNIAALIHLNLEPGQRLLSTSLQPSLVPLVYQKSSKLLMTTKSPTSKNKFSLRTTRTIPPLYPSISSHLVSIIQ